MAYRIERTTVADKVEQLLPLLLGHAEELATHKHLMKVSPLVERYAALEAANQLISLVAYDANDNIIGYSINFITQNMHYGDLRYSHNDVLYVTPAHRGGRLGLMLIHQTELEAAAEGARLIIWHAKPDTALEGLLPRLGYGVQDVLFSKEL